MSTCNGQATVTRRYRKKAAINMKGLGEGWYDGGGYMFVGYQRPATLLTVVVVVDTVCSQQSIATYSTVAFEARVFITCALQENGFHAPLPGLKANTHLVFIIIIHFFSRRPLAPRRETPYCRSPLL